MGHALGLAVRAARLAVTVGDPAGIGPEVVLKALAAADRPAAEVIVYGPMAVLRDRARRFGLPAPRGLGARVVDVPWTGAVRPGRDLAGGRAAAAEAVLRRGPGRPGRAASTPW